MRTIKAITYNILFSTN